MNNLAAAVELKEIINFRNSIDEIIVKEQAKLMYTEFEERCAEWFEKNAETIIAELGSQSRILEYWRDKAKERPPVAGLAELTDEQLLSLWETMNNASKFFCSSPQNIGNWAAEHNQAVTKAAREFLGKVDG